VAVVCPPSAKPAEDAVAQQERSVDEDPPRSAPRLSRPQQPPGMLGRSIPGNFFG
jgi:hypothetical protein